MSEELGKFVGERHGAGPCRPRGSGSKPVCRGFSLPNSGKLPEGLLVVPGERWQAIDQKPAGAARVAADGVGLGLDRIPGEHTGQRQVGRGNHGQREDGFSNQMLRSRCRSGTAEERCEYNAAGKRGGRCDPSPTDRGRAPAGVQRPQNSSFKPGRWWEIRRAGAEQGGDFQERIFVFHDVVRWGSENRPGAVAARGPWRAWASDLRARWSRTFTAPSRFPRMPPISLIESSSR